MVSVVTDSYYMGEDFGEIFYIDENWLYYSEYGEGDSESVYRVPFSHKDGKEYPEFSKKEFLFSEPEVLCIFSLPFLPSLLNYKH